MAVPVTVETLPGCPEEYRVPAALIPEVCVGVAGIASVGDTDSIVRALQAWLDGQAVGREVQDLKILHDYLYFNLGPEDFDMEVVI